METYIINNIEEFHLYFKLLKESASIGSNPESFLVGFDIEFIDDCHFITSYEKRRYWIRNINIKIVPCIIQLATYDICLVINLVKLGLPLPKKLEKLIVNNCWIKVGVGVEGDLKYLSDAFNLGHCGGGIEIQNLGLLALAKNNSLANMYNVIVGSNIKKDSSICNWAGELGDNELLYAARDAVISHQLFDHIMRPVIDNIKNINNKIQDRLEIKFMNHTIEDIRPITLNNGKHNYIGLLNEYSMKKCISKPLYKTITLNTQPVTFKVECTFDGVKEYCIDKNKKNAKHQVAKKVYTKIN